jgi:hypothetical protein
MKITGSELRGLIRCGLEVHKNHLTLGIDKNLHQFLDSLDDNIEYDLFCCIAELLLKSDEDSAPIIADLMKVARTDLEMIGDHTFANIGFVFSDWIKRYDLIDYYRRRASSIDEADSCSNTL